MIKLITFDLDDTLCPLDRPSTPETVAMLHEMEDLGVRIAVCSGKPTFYLCGFLRQIGLKRPMLVGENGAVIQEGVGLPPDNFRILPYSEEAKKTIAALRKGFEEAVPGLFYQPNLVGLTPFFNESWQFDRLQAVIDATPLRDVTVYPQGRCYDIVPANLSKRVGMEALGEMLGISPEETVAVGNGINDYPMFEYAGYSVGVNLEHPEKVNVNFGCTEDALAHLLALCRQERG